MELATELNRALHGGSPFEGFRADRYPLDLQGWFGGATVLDQLIDQLHPRFLIEVGTWKGLSAVHSIRRALTHNEDVAILCIDTWLGSYEHWLEAPWKEMLNCRNGFPQLYEQFLANIMHSGLQDYVVPLPLSSGQAAILIDKLGLKSDFVYLDGGHDERSVQDDIDRFWPLVIPYGVLVGDDYSDTWPGVKKAVHRFFESAGDIFVHGTGGGKWYAQKKKEGSHLPITLFEGSPASILGTRIG